MKTKNTVFLVVWSQKLNKIRSRKTHKLRHPPKKNVARAAIILLFSFFPFVCVPRVCLVFCLLGCILFLGQRQVASAQLLHQVASAQLKLQHSPAASVCVCISEAPYTLVKRIRVRLLVKLLLNAPEGSFQSC